MVAVVTAGAVVALMTLAHAVHRHPVVRSVLLAGAAGIAFGMASVFTKTVAVEWTEDGTFAQCSSLLVIAALATSGMLLSQASYRGAGLAAPLATVTVVNPVVAAAVGITMFGETFRYGTTGTVLALACGVVAAGGLILLTTERISGSRKAAAESVVAALPAQPTPDVTARRSPTASRWSRRVGAPARDGRARGGRKGRGRSTTTSGTALATSASNPDAARPQIGQRVDVGTEAGPRPHLEVQMRARAVARGAGARRCAGRPRPAGPPSRRSPRDGRTGCSCRRRAGSRPRSRTSRPSPRRRRGPRRRP